MTYEIMILLKPKYGHNLICYVKIVYCMLFLFLRSDRTFRDGHIKVAIRVATCDFHCFSLYTNSQRAIILSLIAILLTKKNSENRRWRQESLH